MKWQRRSSRARVWAWTSTSRANRRPHGWLITGSDVASQWPVDVRSGCRSDVRRRPGAGTAGPAGAAGDAAGIVAGHRAPDPLRRGGQRHPRVQRSQVRGRGAFHTYRFDAKADKHYIITLDAPDFDAWLWVARIVGGLSEELAQDDDGGEGTNSRLRFRPPAAGSYIIVAQSLSEEGLGPYTVRVEETDRRRRRRQRPSKSARPSAVS